jgi:peptide-methionine (S)-S-oxide reductase
LPNPTYHSIGDHTECFQVDFDPQVVSYGALLELVLTSHDPFRAAFKGQYASLVLTHDDAQLATARAVASSLEAARGHKLATRIEPIKRFTNAEEYHQKYSLRNDRVLMADFRAMFGADEDALRESTAAARVNGYVAGDGSGVQLEREIESLGLTEGGRAELAARFRRRSGGIGCSIG